MLEQDNRHLKRILVAAADLENAEFERDRLAVVCREAVESALRDEVPPAEVAAAAGIPESDLARLLGAPRADDVVPILSGAPEAGTPELTPADDVRAVES